jgi:hypothetical protein
VFYGKWIKEYVNKNKRNKKRQMSLYGRGGTSESAESTVSRASGLQMVAMTSQSQRLLKALDYIYSRRLYFWNIYRHLKELMVLLEI